MARAAIARGLPFLGICVGFQLLYEGSEEDPGDPGLGDPARHGAALPDGVKHPQMQWNQLARRTASVSGLLARARPRPWVYFVHSYAPEVTEATTWRPATTAAPVDRLGRARTGVGHPVPPREVRRVGPGASWPTSWPPARTPRRPARLVMDLYPAIDIRDGGAVRLTQGDFDRRDRLRRPGRPGPRRSRPAARRWLHVVDLDAARTGQPVNRAVVLAIAAARRRPGADRRRRA